MLGSIFKTMKTWNYNTEIYDFKKIVQQYLDYDDLSTIHADLAFDKKLTNIAGDAPDQKTKIHRMFYSNMDSNPIFKETYDSFIKEVVPEIVGTDDFLYQKFPTFRVHQPENIAVFAYHKDKEYNHSPKEINLFLPVTRAFDTNTVWAESEEDKGDYSPINCEYGEVVSWDGANLRHGNKDNKTGLTRGSFDFRILKREDYNANEIKESVSNSKKFVEGDYFESNIENHFDESDIDPKLKAHMKKIFGDFKNHKFGDFSAPKTLDPKELEAIMKKLLKKKP